MEAAATPEELFAAEEAFFYDENTQLEGPEVDSEAFLYGLFNPDSQTDFVIEWNYREWLRSIGTQNTELKALKNSMRQSIINHQSTCF